MYPRPGFLASLLLAIGLLLSAPAGAASKWMENIDAQGLRFSPNGSRPPQMNMLPMPSRFFVPRYRPSPLTENQLLEILGVPTGLSEADLRELIKTQAEMIPPIGRTTPKNNCFTRMFFRAIAYALSLQYVPETDAGQWANLAEKRFSYLRDLLNELHSLPETKWTAWDYRLDDQTRIFEGREGEMLAIRPSDGGLFFGPLLHSWKRPWELNYDKLARIESKRLFCSYALKP